MVHHIVLFKLKPEVTPAKVEQLMMQTRIQLLKIPEVLGVKCGKRIEPDCEWPFFVALDFESMDKLEVFKADPIYLKYELKVIRPNALEQLVLNYEMEPAKDVRFS